MPNMSLKKNEMPSQEPNVRNKNFLEVALGYTEEMALDEAQRCLNCKHKPCVNGCPVHIDIPLFTRLHRATLTVLMILFQNQAHCRLYAAEYVHRNHSAKRTVFVV